MYVYLSHINSVDCLISGLVVCGAGAVVRVPPSTVVRGGPVPRVVRFPAGRLVREPAGPGVRGGPVGPFVSVPPSTVV